MGRSGIDIRYVELNSINLGSGDGVFESINPVNTLNFKSLIGGGNIILSANTESILISGTSSNTNLFTITGTSLFDNRTSGISNSNTLALGLVAGEDTNSSGSIYIGNYAGRDATSTVGSVFVGYNAGINAIGTTYATALGIYAGLESPNAGDSVFVGRYAGNNCGNSSRSIMIGAYTGEYSTNSPYSILLGWRTGKQFGTNFIGSNNIIIGTNISLPDAVTNRINIGNVLYGSGTYSTPTGNPSIVPTSAGKIGIGVVTPTAKLHLAAGTSAANTAPLKLTTGTALTTPEDGAIEYHNSHLYFTIGSTRYQLDQQSGVTSSGGSYTFINGLTEGSGIAKLGGTIEETTFLTPMDNTISFALGGYASTLFDELILGGELISLEGNEISISTNSGSSYITLRPTGDIEITPTGELILNTITEQDTITKILGLNIDDEVRWIDVADIGGGSGGTISGGISSGQVAYGSASNTITGTSNYTFTNNPTTGNGLNLSNTTLTSGSLVNLITTSTAAAANGQTVLRVHKSGTNATAGQTTYGARITNANAGTTSTNIGLYASASGGTTNYSLYAEALNNSFGVYQPLVVGVTRSYIGGVDITTESTTATATLTPIRAMNIAVNPSGGAGTGLGIQLTTTNTDQNGLLHISGTWNPSSGSGIFTQLRFANTINQTGSASGPVRGIHYAPTITNILGTHLSFHATSGNVLLPASSYLGFGTVPNDYGFRDNAGTMEYKDSGGTWTAFSSISGGSGSNLFNFVNANIGGSVTIDLSLGDFFILTLTGNVTSFNYTNEVVGMQYIFLLRKSTTDKSFTWASGKYRFPLGNAPLLTDPTTNGTSPALSEDYITAICRSSGRLDVVYTPDMIEN